MLGNPRINCNGRCLKSDTFIKAGVTLVRHVLYETVPGYLPETGIWEIISDYCPEVERGKVQAMYTLIKSCIPADWGHLSQHDTPCGEVQIVVDIKGERKMVKTLTTKDFYGVLRRRVEESCVCIKKWSIVFPKLNLTLCG